MQRDVRVSLIVPKVGGTFLVPGPTGGIFDRATISFMKIMQSSGVFPFMPKRMI